MIKYEKQPALWKTYGILLIIHAGDVLGVISDQFQSKK